MAMGAADVVPGVSGGTIAFITGIYETLITTIDKLDFGLFKHIKKEGLKSAWSHYNLSFLTVLLLGIATSIISLAKLITYLLANHPVLVWAFFFGLIIASIVFIVKQIDRWNLVAIVGLIIAAVVSYWITIVPPLAQGQPLWFLFIAGFIAIIAMILPGLSGAFILLLLGAYEIVIGSITGVIEGITGSDTSLLGTSVLQLAVFAIGAIAGLKTFSKVLRWMFDHYKNTTLAVLTGFMIGALNKVWPWKEILSYRTNHSGEQVALLEKSVLPSQFKGDPMLLMAIGCAVLGCALILGFEWYANRKKTTVV
jgi:putative membrane protein